MATPIRNTVRTAGVRSAYNLSYINTPAGATITGEIRQYATYADMLADPAPARLASVLNGSYDDNYETTVPQEHWGGVLYQRDSVNDTWVLLYNTSDITVPTRVDWEHVVNVPSWVGGVSFNRKKLIQNAYAETRTTYYSYGNYILVLPDPDTVKLGDQIILEQYKGQGAICYPYAEGEENMYLVNIDETLQTEQLYHVLYTTADYSYTRDSTGQMVIDETDPLCHKSYMFTCTENEAGSRIWRLNANTDTETTVIALRREFFSHTRSVDPHHQYIRKNEVGKYISSVIEIGYTLPDAQTYCLGGVYLATVDDVISAKGGNRAVTAYDLHNILLSYSVTGHTHELNSMTDISGSVANGNVLMWDANLQKWVPTAFSASAIVYTDATTTAHGLVTLATADQLTSGTSGAYVPNTQMLSSYLTAYRKVSDNPALTQLSDVNITQLVNDKILTVRNEKVELGDLPIASTTTSGMIQIASSTEIVSGTTVNNKAVTPVQMIDMSSAIIAQVDDMIYNSGYVLPTAVPEQIGGVRLVTDNVLSLIISDAPHFTSHVVASATAVNPMQFAYYLYTTSAAISASTSTYLSAAVDGILSNVSDLDRIASSASVTANNGLALATTTNTALAREVSAAVGVDWGSGSDITTSALRLSAAATNEFVAPANGFIRFKSVPTLDVTFKNNVPVSGALDMVGYISGAGEVHFGEVIRTATDTFERDRVIDLVPVNSGDKIYYTEIMSSGTTSSYLSLGGCEVSFFPKKN